MAKLTALSIILCIFCMSVASKKGSKVSKDAVFLVKLKDGADIKDLYKEDQTSAIYRIKLFKSWQNDKYYANSDTDPQRMDMDSKKMNYIVVAKNVGRPKARKEYEKKIEAVSEARIRVPLRFNPRVKVDFLNKLIKKHEKSSDIVKRPLEADSEAGGCDETAISGIKDDEQVFSLNFHKYNQRKELKKFAGELITKVFPALGAKYTYARKIAHPEWKFLDAFVVMEFPDKKTWCEYALSKLWQSYEKDVPKSFHAVVAYTGVLVKK